MRYKVECSNYKWDVRMLKDRQTRKYQLTINNPIEHGLNHDAIKAQLSTIAIDYYCMADEIGEEGTMHTHLFVFSRSPIRFSTMKSRFPTAHIESAYGSLQQNRDYITKSGIWEKTDKAETSVPDTFEESGAIPEEKGSKSIDISCIIEELQAGKSIVEIVKDNPKYALKVHQLEELRQTLLTEEAKREFRILEVIYIYGKTNTGKTYSVYKENDPSDICRITTYRSSGVNFDGYSGQKCLVFEEFRSQIPIAEMLTYLDKYPCMLPARYTDRVAKFHKVYIVSNLNLREQYVAEQKKQPQSWNAFLRRITEIREQTSYGCFKIHDRKEFEK